MPVTNNNKVQIDLPIWQPLQPLPANSAVGVSTCNDRRGTNRYIYLLISATSFWRYDTWANTYQQLASPPGGTVGAGTCLAFDPSKGTAGYVWALITNGTVAPTFQYYDCAANTWTARSVTNLPATFGTDGHMIHPCTSYSPTPASDDFIYLIGNNATVFYIYTISTNTWATGTAVTGAPGAGCAIHWSGVYNVDKLIVVRGGATASIYEYTISTPGWVTRTLKPATETFTTGTNSCCPSGLGKIYIQKDITGRIYEINLTTWEITPVCTEFLMASGTAHVGDRFNYVITVDAIAFLYLGLTTSAYYQRTPLLF